MANPLMPSTAPAPVESEDTMTLQEAEWHRCRYVKMWQEAERVGDTAQMQKAEDCLAEIDEQILKQEGE